MRNKENNLSGEYLILAGLMLIALVTLGLQVVRIFNVWNIAEFGAIGGVILAWILIFFGASAMGEASAEFKKVRIASAAMVIVTILQGILAFKNLKSGMMNQAYIDVTVMFAAYLGLLGLFYTYRTLLRGTALLIKREDPVLARGCMRAWKPACGIVILTMILIPISAMMPRIVEYIATGVLACLGLLAQGYMCKLLLDGKTTLDDARM